MKKNSVSWLLVWRSVDSYAILYAKPTTHNNIVKDRGNTLYYLFLNEKVWNTTETAAKDGLV